MARFKTIIPAPPSISQFLSPIGMIKNLYSLSGLIRQFALRDVKGRYKGTYLGLIWSLINPLVTLAVYSFVFVIIFKARFATEAGGGRLDFALNLFCGLILYDIFSSCISRASDLIVGNRNYVKKVVFPLEVFPVAVLASNLIDAAMSLAIFIPVLLIFSNDISSTMYLFPLVLVPLCAMTLGLSWFLASIGTFLRDFGQFIQVAIRLLFFLSPVFYPVSAVPEGLRMIFYLNPLVTILENGRHVLIRGQSIDWAMWLAVTAFSLVVLQLGYVWFMKSKRVFGDVV